MIPRLAVGLGSPGLYTAAGLGAERVWDALRTGKTDSVPNTCQLGPWSELAEVFEVPDLEAEALGMHRKMLRSTEKQSRLAVYGARLALDGAPETGGPRQGLYLGLPSVDDESLPLDKAPALHAAANDPQQVAELYLRETSPFDGLLKLNSTAAAHISIGFGLTGSTAVHSPFSDAGLEALIDGALAIVDGDCDTALIGATSPKLSPHTALQYEEHGWRRGAVPGEAAAFLLAGRDEEVSLTGYGRGFGAGAGRSDAIADVLRAALRMADVPAENVGWVLADSVWTDDLVQAQQDAIRAVFGNHAPVFSSEGAVGVTGPAQPLVHVLLARHGLLNGLRLLHAPDRADGAGGAQEQVLEKGKATVVLGLGVRGQNCAVVLEGGAS